MKKYVVFFFLFVFTSLNAQMTVGLFENESGSFDGYTLFASNGYTSTYLIDNCGRLVNEWPGTYRPGSVNYLLEDGYLYRAVRNPGGPFFGGGIGGEIEKLDWEGNIVWSYRYANQDVNQHHDIEILPNGNILILAWEIRSNEEAIEAGQNPATLNGNIWPEHIVEIVPQGSDQATIIWEWHLWDHLVQDFDSTKNNYGEIADHPELVNINYKGTIGNFVQADWVHANAIDYNESRDEIIISSRHLAEFWIIDHSTTSTEAAGHSGGNAGKGGDLLYRWGNPIAYERGTSTDQKLYGQHDVHWIPEGLTDAGHIMIFNNGLNRPGGNASSVDIIVPPLDAEGNYLLEDDVAYGPEAVDWTYFPSPMEEFYSSTLSGAQRLPNGNTLICEGAEGRIFEVTTDGNKLWEYVSPVGTGGPITQGVAPGANGAFRAYRYPASYLAFEGKDLTPGEMIELEPLPSDCQIVSNNNTTTELISTVFPNPMDEQLQVSVGQGEIGQLKLIDTFGRVVYFAEVNSAEYVIPTRHLQEGMYFLILSNKEVTKVICQH